MRPVRAGRLRTRVTVEAVTQTVAANGETVDSWATFAVRWAGVEPVDTSGRQYGQAAAIQADVTHRVEMRYLAGVTPKHRIKIGTRVLEIASVANVEERERMTVLMCKEVV